MYDQACLNVENNGQLTPKVNTTKGVGHIRQFFQDKSIRDFCYFY